MYKITIFVYTKWRTKIKFMQTDKQSVQAFFVETLRKAIPSN